MKLTVFGTCEYCKNPITFDDIYRMEIYGQPHCDNQQHGIVKE